MARWTDNPGSADFCELCRGVVTFPDNRVAIVHGKLLCGNCVDEAKQQQKTAKRRHEAKNCLLGNPFFMSREQMKRDMHAILYGSKVGKVVSVDLTEMEKRATSHYLKETKDEQD